MAYKRALKKAGIRPRRQNQNRRFGSGLYKQVCEFQKRRGLHVDGIIGPQTYARMYHLFGAYDRWLLKHTRVRPRDAAQTIRNRLVNIAMYEKRQAAYIHYSMGGSRMNPIKYGWRVPAADYRRIAYTDCSAFVTWVYWQAGCPDPNGRGYDGYGFTGTLTQHGQLVNSGFLPGDLVFYGRPISHVAMYVGNGKVVSHGSDPGPYLLPMRYRWDLTEVRRYRLA